MQGETGSLADAFLTHKPKSHQGDCKSFLASQKWIIQYLSKTYRITVDSVAYMGCVYFFMSIYLLE